MTSKRWVCAIIMMMTLATLLSACGDTGGGDGKVTVRMFFHSARASELDAMNASIKAFEDKNPKIHVEIVKLVEGEYTQQVNAAVLSRSLPCMLDMDGPNMYNYAWAGNLIPIEKYVTDELKSDLLASVITQGTYNNHLYSLGQYDSGLGLYANKKYLTDAGITNLPTFDKPWTLDEFNEVLAKLKAVSGVKYPLDLLMSMNGGKSEWYTFGFSPFLQSFGGDLINRSNYKSADGKLNGPEAIKAMTWFQGLFKQGYADPKPAGDTDFSSGRSALSWVGHWQYATYKQALGDNLLVLPAPNLGKGAKTGMGSWSWGITSSCKNPDEAWKVIDFLLSSDQIKGVTDANGAVPARRSVHAKSSLYADNGPLHVYVQQLESDVVVPRPLTPGFPAITKAFQDVVANISTGADVKSELDKAVQAINEDFKGNQYYPVK